jgi:hypothetical protein
MDGNQRMELQANGTRDHKSAPEVLQRRIRHVARDLASEAEVLASGWWLPAIDKYPRHPANGLIRLAMDRGERDNTISEGIMHCAPVADIRHPPIQASSFTDSSLCGAFLPQHPSRHRRHDTASSISPTSRMPLHIHHTAYIHPSSLHSATRTYMRHTSLPSIHPSHPLSASVSLSLSLTCRPSVLPSPTPPPLFNHENASPCSPSAMHAPKGSG